MLLGEVERALEHLQVVAERVGSAHHRRAEFLHPFGAALDNGLRRHRADRPVDLDVVIVDRGGEAGQEARLQHQPDAPLVGLFRLEQRIAPRGAGELDRGVVLGGIEQHVDAGRPGREQFAQVGRPDIARPRGAEAEIGDRFIGDPGLPGGDIARSGIVGAAHRAIKVKPFEHRHQQFDIAFGHVVRAEAGQEVAHEPPGAEIGRDFAGDLFAAVFSAHRDRDRTGRQGEGIERQVGREHVLFKPLAAEGIAQHIVERGLAGDADPHPVERNAAVGRRGQRRTADDRSRRHADGIAGRGEHRVLRQRQAGIVGDVARHFASAADALLVVGIPPRAAAEQRESAVHPGDIALQFTLGVVLADRQIGIGGAQRELGDAQRRQLVARRGGDEGIVRADRDVRLVELNPQPAEVLRLGIGALQVDVERVGHLVADPAEQALAVFFRIERLEAVDLGRLPVSANHPRVAHRAIDKLADRAALAKHRAAQRGVVDDPARRRLAQPGARNDQPFRQAVAGHIGRVVDHVPTAVVPFARHPVQPFLDRQFAVEQHMAAVVGKAGPGGQVDAVAGSIAARGDPILRGALDAGVFLVENEVDHARDSVGTISGRSTAGDDFNALDQPLREGVYVNQPAHRGADRALPVEQHQGAGRAQRAQVERVDPGGAGADVEVRVGRGDTADQRGNIVDVIGHVGRGASLDVLVVEDGQRGWRLVAVALDAGAGNGDVLGFGFGRGRRILRQRRCGPQQRDRHGGSRRERQ